MIGFMLMQNFYVNNKTWILLESCSTYSVKNNLDCVEDKNNRAKHE